jgi:putative heme-binding domain-containing protein
MDHLNETDHGSSERGAQVFEKARCSECHRLGARGERVGPDLTGITKQYMRREVLQSVLYPSHAISEEFQTKTVITTSGRAYTGVISSDARGDLTVLQSTGEKVTVLSAHVDEVIATRRSIMPSGLLDDLTIDEITDLFAYLGLLPPQNVARTPRAAPTR